MAAPRAMMGHDSARAAMERGKRTRRAVPFILAGEGSAAAKFQRQSWLRTAQSLDLALLVHPQLHRILRGWQIDTDHIGELPDEADPASV